MKNKIIIIAIVIIGIFISLKVFSNSDKQEIGIIIDDLESSLEYQKSLPSLAVLSRLKKVSSHMAPDFTAKYVGNTSVKSLENTDSIKANALMAARYFSNIDIFKLPFLIEVKSEKASTSLKATISGEDIQGVKFKELFDIAIEFIKLEGKWYCLSIIATRLTPDSDE